MSLAGNLSLIKDSFCLQTGDFILPATGVSAIFGLSGSGKTTFLRALAGFENEATGQLNFGEQVWLNKKKSTPIYKRQLGYVFQEASLFQHLDVKQNLEYGLKRAKGNQQITLNQVIDWLGVEKLLNRDVANLSGGEKQRVAIGRALLSQPNILMMDEPLASLDVFAKRQIMPYLEKLTKELAIPILYITHSAEEVERLADTVVFMADGKITAIEPLGEALNKKNTPLYQHQEPKAVLSAVIKYHHVEDALFELSVGNAQLFIAEQAKKIGETIRLVIPANQVSLVKEQPEASSMLNYLAVTIEEIDDFNKYSKLIRLRIENATLPLLAQITNRSVQQLQLQPQQRWVAAIKTVSIL
jgi:molybdate transport system ATP-binding protein